MKKTITNIQTLKNWGMGLVILGIMFGIGLAVLGGIEGDLYEVADEDLTDTFTVEEADLPENVTLSTVTEAVDVHEVRYETDGGDFAVLSTSYYNVYEDDGQVEITGDENNEYPDDAADTDTQIEVDYDNLESGDASEGVNDAIEGISEFTGWFPLIALVVVAAVIITLVQSGFGSNGNRRRRTSRA